MKEKISKLFGDSGKAVYIPIDHGIGGVKKGLENPIEILETLVSCGIDGTLMQYGLAKQTISIFEKNPAIKKIIALDYRHYWKIPGFNDGLYDCFQYATVKQAIDLNCDAVKVMVPYGENNEFTIKALKIVASVLKEASEYKVPVMVEPLPTNNCDIKYKNNFEVLNNIVRISYELGADLLKIPYIGTKEEFSKMVKDCPVPIMVLGGSPTDINELFIRTEEIIKTGSKGVVFGRNVWGHPQMKGVVKGLIEIVHHNANPSEVVKKYNLIGKSTATDSYAF